MRRAAPSDILIRRFRMSHRTFHRFLASGAACFAGGALTVMLLAPEPVAGQGPRAVAKGTVSKTIPRTPDGHPDFQGVWNNSSLTPLERLREFEGKQSVTEEEATAYEKQNLEQNNRDRRDGGAEADVGRAYNELWFDRGNKLARIGSSIRTSFIINPPDGKIPALTPEAQKRMEAIRAYARLHPADEPKDRSLAERCVYWGTSGPPMLPGPYNNLYQIYQTPGHVMILSEMIHEVRVIPLDGRPHLPSNIRKWMGDSIGRWEGDTLVVDTTNFTDKTRFRGSSENLHVVERFSRLDAETLLYRFTIDDAATWTRPWTGEYPWPMTSDNLYE